LTFCACSTGEERKVNQNYSNCSPKKTKKQIARHEAFGHIKYLILEDANVILQTIQQKVLGTQRLRAGVSHAYRTKYKNAEHTKKYEKTTVIFTIY
jgi:hypothetical protein